MECSIECTPGRVRLKIRHQPALLPGALTPTPEGTRALRGLALDVADRLNDARDLPTRHRARTPAAVAPRGGTTGSGSPVPLLPRTAFIVPEST